eukprot:m.460525 g.460525  ORF g.460525 m.460525 type:complete len:147 (+) comp22057_c0_seq1:127-567(+)
MSSKLALIQVTLVAVTHVRAQVTAAPTALPESASDSYAPWWQIAVVVLAIIVFFSVLGYCGSRPESVGASTISPDLTVGATRPQRPSQESNGSGLETAPTDYHSVLKRQSMPNVSEGKPIENPKRPPLNRSASSSSEAFGFGDDAL